MDYLTQNFTPERILPIRKLAFPLVVHSNNEVLTQPVICGGNIYREKAGVCINVYEERDLTLKDSNDKKSVVKGVFGLNEKSMLSETKEGKVCEFLSSDLSLLGEFDLGVIHTARTVSCKQFYILMCRENRSRSFPLKVGRKNVNDDTLLWSFAPNKSLSSFSVAEDKSLVIVTDSSGGIYALDIGTGEVQWQKDVQSLGALTLAELNNSSLGNLSVFDNPHIYNDTIAMGYLFEYMVGIDLHSGELKWKRKFETEVSYTTVDIEGRQHYLSSNSRASTLFIVDSETGESIREFTLDLKTEEIKRKFTSSVYSDVTTTHFWGVSGKGLLYAINLESGEIDWHYDLEGSLSHNPFFICNNRLYISTLTEQFIFEGQGGYVPD